MSGPGPLRTFDSAYPGSMFERVDGGYVERDDHKSLAAALVAQIDSRNREIEDLREAIATDPRNRPVSVSARERALIAALRSLVLELMDYTPIERVSTESYVPGSLIGDAQAALALYGEQIAPTREAI